MPILSPVFSTILQNSSTKCSYLDVDPNNVSYDTMQLTEDSHQAKVANQEELEAHKKLISVYKATADDSEAKVEELISAVQELQGIVKSSMEGNHHDYYFHCSLFSFFAILSS